MSVRIDRVTVRIQWSEGLGHHEVSFTMNAPDPGDPLLEAILQRSRHLAKCSVAGAPPDDPQLNLAFV